MTKYIHATKPFQVIKAKLPTHVSLVETVAEQLHISNNSAYRRLRGDKTLTIFELPTVATHFGISIDDFFGHLQKPAQLQLTDTFIERNNGDIKIYLQGLIDQLIYFNGFGNKKIIYINQDIPIFHYFLYPELAAFKCYFWSRYNFNYGQNAKGQFNLDKLIDIYTSLSEKIATLYSTLPATEVWNLDSITLP